MDTQKEISLRNAISYCIENNDVNTATNKIMEFIRDEKEAITVAHSCETVKDEAHTLTIEFDPTSEQAQNYRNEQLEKVLKAPSKIYMFDGENYIELKP